MTGSSSVKVNGLAELGEALKAFGPVIASWALIRATYAAAAMIEVDAQARAPVLTGALKAHVAIFKRPNPDANTVQYAVGVRGIKLNKKLRKLVRNLKRATGKRVNIAGDVYYWSFDEFGSSHQRAKPFLTPAFESQKLPAIAAFSAVLADGVAAAAAQVAP
jgi:HK97 gp10 family phage protein